MTKKTTSPTNGSDPTTTRNGPRLRHRTLRVLTSADLELVNGGAIRTGDETSGTVSRVPTCQR